MVQSMGAKPGSSCAIIKAVLTAATIASVTVSGDQQALSHDLGSILDEEEEVEMLRLSALLKHVSRENAWSSDSRDIIESMKSKDEERTKELLLEREIYATEEKKRIVKMRQKEIDVLMEQDRKISLLVPSTTTQLDHRILQTNESLVRQPKSRHNETTRIGNDEAHVMEEDWFHEEDFFDGKVDSHPSAPNPPPASASAPLLAKKTRQLRGLMQKEITKDDDLYEDQYERSLLQISNRNDPLRRRRWTGRNNGRGNGRGNGGSRNRYSKAKSDRQFYFGRGDNDDEVDCRRERDRELGGYAFDYWGYQGYNYGISGGKSGKGGKGNKNNSFTLPGFGNGLVSQGKSGKQGKRDKRGKKDRCDIDITDDAIGNVPTPRPTPRPTRDEGGGGGSARPTWSNGASCRDGCPDCDADTPLPCPPSSLKRVCDKHNDELYPPGNPRAGERVANFIDCYDMCKPSFCCIHDSLSQVYSPTCSSEYENCFLYYPCYIIWWKLHDTIGPATYLRVEQDEPFFNVDFEFLTNDFQQDQPFFQQLFGHHFDNDDAPTDDTFEDQDNW